MNSEQYTSLCGSCHFAYQPGLLPTVSWEKLISNTDTHFGLKLKLSSADLENLTRYLLGHSAGHANDAISNNILQSITYSPILIQITRTPYFIATHKNIEQNKDINIGQCDSCHKQASQGKY